MKGGTQRRVLPRNQVEETEILNISFPRVGIESTTRAPAYYLLILKQLFSSQLFRYLLPM